MKSIILTLIVSSLLSLSTHAKDGRTDNQNTNPGIISSCDLGSADNRYWHKDQVNYPYEKMTCEFKEYLSINSKGPHCGINTKARVIFAGNCSKNGIPQADMAMTTYFPGYGCWNDINISGLDAAGFENIKVGSKIEIIAGAWGGMGYGTGVNVARDIHQISIAGKSFCPTNHSMVPHVMMLVAPENEWLRETF